MAREFRPLGLEDEMPFGKYYGTVLSELTELDAGYLLWIRGEKSRSFFDGDVNDVLDEKQKEREDAREGRRNREFGL